MGIFDFFKSKPLHHKCNECGNPTDVEFKICSYCESKKVSNIPEKEIKKVSNIPENILNRWFDKLVDQLTNGDLAPNFPSNVIMKKNEKLVLGIPSVSYCEERSVRSKGTAKYRIQTQFAGGTEWKIVTLDTGDFTLTNKRLIFSGSTKSVEYPFSKIVTLDILENGIVINRSGKTKMEYFVDTTNISLWMTIKPKEGEDFEAEKVEYKFTGIEVKKIIEQIIQKY